MRRCRRTDGSGIPLQRRLFNMSTENLALKDPSLLRQQAYINGEWQSAANGESFEVRNPATGGLLGTVPAMGAAETRQAIDAANAAWPAWRKKTAKERAAILRKWHDLMMENADDLALILTTEQGKPLAEAKARSATRRRSSNGSPRKASACTATRSRRRRATSASS
jgi:delta 1-pyrroline-5-carboxylate dehydrogenase